MYLRFLTLALFTSNVMGEKCSTPVELKSLFGNYLVCIKDQLDKSYADFEMEISNDTRKSVEQCFARTIEEGNRKEICVLAPNDLNSSAWDRNGPLRDCSICRTFASAAIKAVLSTREEDQKCVRSEITKAVAKEANHCIKKKIADFPGIPDIPDIEEKSFAYKDSIVTSISDFILIHSRLAFCNDRKPTRAEATKECLKNPFPGYYAKHCEALHACDIKLDDCMPKIISTKEATCSCISETRDELKSRIYGIAQAIKNSIEDIARGSIGSSSRVDMCVAGIKSKMITEVNDWVDVIDSAVSRCLSRESSGQPLGLDSLLNVGCRKVIADTTGTALTQLKSGFNFINNLIDAMIDRSGRFCGGSYCTQ